MFLLTSPNASGYTRFYTTKTQIQGYDKDTLPFQNLKGKIEKYTKQDDNLLSEFSEDININGLSTYALDDLYWFIKIFSLKNLSASKPTSDLEKWYLNASSFENMTFSTFAKPIFEGGSTIKCYKKWISC